MKKWFLAFLLAVFAIAPIFYIAYYNRHDLGLFSWFSKSDDNNNSAAVAVVQFEQYKPPTLEVGSQFTVVAAQVLDGHIFSLILESGEKINAQLCHATKPEATKVVVELLQSAEPPAPTVKLKRKLGGYWLVEFELTIDKRRVTMLDYLKQKDLLL